MTRAILYLIAFALIFGVVQSVIRIVAKGFSDFFSAAQSPGPGAQSRPQPLPTQEALKKDPVCGTFLPASSAVRKTINGQTYFFCSPGCRDKFKA